MQDTKVRFDLPGNELMPELLGHVDELLQVIEISFPKTKIHVRGNQITIDGESAVLVEQVFREMTRMLERGLTLDASILKKTIEMVKEDENPSEILTTELLINARGKPVRAKSLGQKNYLDTASRNIITFAVGPAGTGKSWLAVALAVSAMQTGEVDRIILTRPLVEAGERVGFLPGDLMAKVDPYFRPLYDALFDMLEPEKAERLLERGQIEVAPLAFMRGRTLNNSFIILDEAQNTTPEQMKMFLTRIGFGSRVIVTGDASQVDVPGGRSGIEGLENIFSGIDGLGFVKLGARDVVRHKIVQDIVQAYENAERQSKKNSGNK
ncbi:MAG: PhoH-like protein [Acidimicrobiaceae bacterium]|nr:MAG: PhoH-like protein [Acidimicrobiaceae bacterium]